MNKPLLATNILTFASFAAAQSWENCDPIRVHDQGQAGDQRGFLGVSLGDLTGDQVAEYLVGAPFRGNNAGRAWVHDGATGSTMFVFQGANFDNLGWQGAAAGDVDNDGTIDVLVGAPNLTETGTGKAFVYSGATGTALLSLVGEANGDRFGNAVSSAGDVDGDGHDDVLVAAPFHDALGDKTGRVYLYSGQSGAKLRTFTGDAGDDVFGAGVATLGDVTGDGIPDHLLAALRGGVQDLGEAYVVSGFDGSRVHTLFADATGGGGYGLLYLGLAGDLSGDGLADFTISDIRADVFGPNTGRVYAYSGADFSLLYVLDGLGADDSFGAGRGRIGDLDGDNCQDLAFGHTHTGSGGKDAGRVSLFSGRSGAPIGRYTGDIVGAQFGFDVSGLGDVDGDGVGDLLITAPGVASQAGAAFVLSGAPRPPFAHGVPSPNSVGSGVVVDYEGSTSTVDGSLALRGAGGPPGASGFLVGRRCAAGGPPQVAVLLARAPVTFDAGGEVEVLVGGFATVAPGETWDLWFLYWEAGSALRSNRLRIVFCP